MVTLWFQIVVTVSEESSDINIELLLLLSSRPNIYDRTLHDPCFREVGIKWSEARPTKDDCNIYNTIKELSNDTLYIAEDTDESTFLWFKYIVENAQISI